MKFLGDDESWQLFWGKAFGEKDCPLELEEIGKKIVKRCRGLPLSIVVIRGHLRRSSRAVEYWEKVANYMNPISSLGADDQCLNIINLSYEHLPLCLKLCFLYLGIYPEDKWIYASKLIRYWIVKGFLKPNEGLSLEEVGKDYLQHLIDMNLIFVRERRWNRKAEICVIHDLVRSCIKVGKKEKFMCVLQDTTQTIGIQRERRIAIPVSLPEGHDTGALELSPLLHSLLCLNMQSLDELRVELRLLRVSAYVNHMYPKKDGICFLAANFQQLNLRYLAFMCRKPTITITSERAYLPSAISLLWNSQSLVIKNVGVLISAPYEIWEMPQLRHLHFERLCLPDPLPSDGSNQQECVVLRNLHTLEGAVNFRFTEEVCKRMPNIKILSLWYLDDCEANSYYCPHNLGRFNKLESLNCFFSPDSRWREIVLSFTYPSSLEKLFLWNCHPDWEDLTMKMKSLPHLGHLQLNSVKGNEWNLVDEEFPSLKSLRISGCDDLIYWNANNCQFPALDNLDILNSHKLSEIPFDIGEIPKLKT